MANRDTTTCSVYFHERFLAPLISSYQVCLYGMVLEDTASDEHLQSELEINYTNRKNAMHSCVCNEREVRL